MKTPRSHVAVEKLKLDTEEAIGKFLRSRGWEYKCDLPGSLWLWVKSFNGHKAYVSQSTALHIEASLTVESELARC